MDREEFLSQVLGVDYYLQHKEIADKIYDALKNPHLQGAERTKNYVSALDKALMEIYGTPLSRYSNPCRSKRYNDVRQMAIFLLRDNTTLSTPEIGQMFNRDHSTIIHAQHIALDRKRYDMEFARKLSNLEKTIQKLLI